MIIRFLDMTDLHATPSYNDELARICDSVAETETTCFDECEMLVVVQRDE